MKKKYYPKKVICTLSFIIIMIIIVTLSISVFSIQTLFATHMNGDAVPSYVLFNHDISLDHYVFSIASQQAFASNESQNVTAVDEKKASMGVVSYSLLLSTLIVVLLFFIVNWSLRESGNPKSKFEDIIRDGSGFPSLARFQFLLWTFVVMFAVMSVFFTRLLMGNPEIPDEIPNNLLILMGISIAVPFVSIPLSNRKYGDRRPTKGVINDVVRRPLATMVMENDKITVSRFQMFAWTWISIIIYLGYFFSNILTSNASTLTVPDIPEIFVILMGLTQAGYLGTKNTLPKIIALTNIAPKEGPRGSSVTIYGANFGQSGKVFFENKNLDEDGDRFYVGQDKTKWGDTRIEIIVPELEVGKSYYVRVENNELTTFKGGGLKEESKFKVR